MSETYICPHGHQWQRLPPSERLGDATTLVCPLCGLPGTLLDTEQDTESTGKWQPGRVDDVPTADSQFKVSVPGRYEIRREIGRGGMGVVYPAIDRQYERSVALKVMQRIDPKSLERFKREFRSLADVIHPNLVDLYDLFSDGQTWFFTMEFIVGVDFLSYVRGKLHSSQADSDCTERFSVSRFERLRSALRQLCSSISALHAAGLLHRDLKPSNVLVETDGRLVLLDFGLATPFTQSGSFESDSDPFLGTIGYLSPEQAGGEVATPASDWYAFGVMLYQGLTGRLPIEGAGLQVLHRKCREEASFPRDIQDLLPADLVELCLGLLHRDPGQRFSESEVRKRLRISHDLTVASPRNAIRDHIFVGRDMEIQALRNGLAKIADGECGLLHVMGESGMGKSRLVRHFLHESRQAGVVVLAGRCFPQESVPFKAIDSIVDAIAHSLRYRPPADVAAIMPRDLASLVDLFPILDLVPAVRAAPRPLPSHEDLLERKRRAIRGLRELLSRLADRHPLVIWTDDLQWGDADSADFLFQVLRPPDPPRLLVVTCCRGIGDEAGPLVKRLTQLEQTSGVNLNGVCLPLQPLRLDDARRLTRQILQDETSNEVVDRIVDESEGNVFFICELCRDSSAILSLSPARGTSDSILDAFIGNRVESLPAADRRILEVVAVAGHPLPQNLLRRAARSGSATIAAIRRLQVQCLLRGVQTGVGSELDTYHDRIRNAVERRLPSEIKQQVHQAIAECMEERMREGDASLISEMPSEFAARPASVADAWFELSVHWSAAGHTRRAIAYALPAADHALRRHSLDAAEQQYRIASQGLLTASRAQALRIWTGLGEVLMLRGAYQEAETCFRQAAIFADDAWTNARIEGFRGELAFKQGDMHLALDCLRRGLQLLGERPPRWRATIFLRLLGEIVIQAVHSIAPARVPRRRRFRDEARERLTWRLYSRLSYAYWFSAGWLPSLWAHLTEMNRAELYPPTPELAQAYSEHVVAISLSPQWLKRGIVYAHKSLRLRRIQRDSWGEGQSLHFYGALLYSASRFRQCLTRCRRAVDILERTGDYWEVNIARYHIGSSRYRLGQLREAVEIAKSILESGRALGDRQAVGISLDLWAKAGCGRVEVAVVEQELARTNQDAQCVAHLLQAKARIQLHQGQPIAAIESLKQALKVSRQSGIHNVWTSPIYPWLAYALRTAGKVSQCRKSTAARHLLLLARRAARRAIRVANVFRNDLPFACRELGLIEWELSRTRRALHWLESSRRTAEQQDAQYELAQTRLALGQLSDATTGGLESDELRRLRQEVESMEASAG